MNTRAHPRKRLDLHILSPAASGALTRWTETLALTVLPPLAAYQINPDDPFFLRSGFPWLIFPPLLLGIRYGALHGLASVLATIAAITAAWSLKWPSVASFPSELAVGLLFVGLISGEFCDFHERRFRKLLAHHDHLAARTAGLARAYHFLKGSNALLERKMAGQTSSLREAFAQLEGQLQDLDQGETVELERVAGPILDFFCARTSIQIAGLYALWTPGQLNPKPLATYGKPPPVALTNPVLREAIATRQVVSIGADGPPAADRVLAAIPLADTEDHLWGLILINELPVFDFNRETLGLLGVMGGRIGDLLSRRRSVAGRGNRQVSLWQTLERAVLENRYYGIPSAVVAAVGPLYKLDAELNPVLLSESRLTDRIWRFRSTHSEAVTVKLLALSDRAALDAYMLRTTGHALPATGPLRLAGSHITIAGWCIDGSRPAPELIGEIREACRIGEPATLHTVPETPSLDSIPIK